MTRDLNGFRQGRLCFQVVRNTNVPSNDVRGERQKPRLNAVLHRRGNGGGNTFAVSISDEHQVDLSGSKALGEALGTIRNVKPRKSIAMEIRVGGKQLDHVDVRMKRKLPQGRSEALRRSHQHGSLRTS